MKPIAKQQVSGRLLLAGFIVVLVPIIAVMIWSTAHKGVWFDEIWSKWMSSRELGLAEVARERWFQDLHPPLFYLYNWAASAIIGPEIAAHRGINMVLLAALGGIGAYIWHIRTAMRPALVVGALLLLSNRDIVLLAEYRSYALIACSTAALTLLLGEVLARGRDLALPADRTLMLLLGALIMLSLNLHYISTLICGITIGVFSLDRARLGQWRWFAMMMGVATLAMLPVFGALWAERSFMAAAVPDFWVKTSVFAAFKMMGGKVAFAAGLNLVVIGYFALALHERFIKNCREGVGDGSWHFATLAGLSVLASCALLLAVNVFRPVIVPRYLIALSPITIVVLAVIVADRIAAQRWIFIAFLANAAIVALVLMWSIQKKPAWDEGARIVAAAVRACPDTIVYSIWRMDGYPVSKFTALPNEIPFITWAMADIGRKYGLSPRFIDPATPPAALPLSPAGCPTILWVEHAAALDGPRTAAAAGLTTGGSTNAALHTTHTGTGTIIVLSPSG
jgi:hypothetical protein